MNVWGNSWGSTWGASWAEAVEPVRVIIVGGDDAPEKRFRLRETIDKTLEEVFSELKAGPKAEVATKAIERYVKPAEQGPMIDWKAAQEDMATVKRLIGQWQREEREREEDELILMGIL